MSATLIFGGGGFVGSELVQTLIAAGKSPIILVDRRPVAVTAQLSRTNRGVEILAIQADSLNSVSIPWEIETVIVLAGQTDVDEALEFPTHAFRANVDIAIEAGEWLRRNPRARLVYLSSDEVLGASSVPLGESSEMRPTQPYAASKAAAEMILDCYCRTYNLDLVILRSCNLVGGGQRARKLIPIAVTKLGLGEPVPIYGSGEHVREWLAVEDLCNAILYAVHRRMPAGRYHCSVSFRLRSVDVVELVATAMHVEPRWSHVSDRLVHDVSYAMSSDLLKSYGWLPRQDVPSAIKAAARSLERARQAGEDLTGRDKLGPTPTVSRLDPRSSTDGHPECR